MKITSVRALYRVLQRASSPFLILTPCILTPSPTSPVAMAEGKCPPKENPHHHSPAAWVWSQLSGAAAMRASKPTNYFKSLVQVGRP